MSDRLGRIRSEYEARALAWGFDPYGPESDEGWLIREVERLRVLFAAEEARADRLSDRLLVAMKDSARLRALIAEPSNEQMERWLNLCKQVWEASSLPGRERGAEQISAILADLRERAGGERE